MAELKWEKGYRSHGLWDGKKRIAIIGLTPNKIYLPPEFREQYRTEYTCSIDETGETWTKYSLKEAKKSIEEKLL